MGTVTTAWRASQKSVTPGDRFHTKLAQAEALGLLMLSEDFKDHNEAIRHNIKWLLSDLLTETREAFEDWRSGDGQ